MLPSRIAPLFGVLAVFACSAAPPPGAQRAARPEPEPPAARPAPQHVATTSAELGGLDEREAEQSFRASLDGLEACIRDGVQRLEFIGGSIEFAVKVDATRHPEVWAAESTLGERGTEKCMFDVLRSVSWPAPEGGAFGIARNAFEFKPRRGVVTPSVWDAGRISGVLAGLDGQINVCRGQTAGRLVITLYIGPGGKALGGGVASREPVEERAVDCVVDTLLAADYPTPEHTPTKVRFQL